MARLKTNGVVAWGVSFSLALMASACVPTRYVSPVDGPTATLEISSICTERASFYARIDGIRTQTYGCNQSAGWLVTPGTIELTIQVEQSSFTVEPLVYEFQIEQDQCAEFMLRQARGGGFELEVLTMGECS